MYTVDLLYAVSQATPSSTLVERDGFHFFVLSTAVSLCSDGELRLVDGPTAFAGRLEICFDNVWGTVCDRFRSWSGNVNPAVVCRQLGYDTNCKS